MVYSYTLCEEWICHQDVCPFKFHLSASMTRDVSLRPTYENVSVSFWIKIFLLCFSWKFFQISLSCIKYLFATKFLLARRLSTPRPPSAHKNCVYLVWHQNNRVSEVRQCSLVLRLKHSLIVVKEKRIRENQKSSWSEKVEHGNIFSWCLIENFLWSFWNTFYNIVLVGNIVLTKNVFKLIM